MTPASCAVKNNARGSVRIIKCESVLGRRVVLGLLVRGGVALQVLVPAGAVLEDGPGARLRRSPGPLGPDCSPVLLCRSGGIVLFNAPTRALEMILRFGRSKIKFSTDVSSMSLMQP